MSTTLESIYRKSGEKVDFTPAAAITGGQVIQLPDGRAAGAAVDIAAGVQGSVQVSGLFDVLKVASVVIINGAGIWWDHSANAATPVPQFGDRDFYIGAAVADYAAGVTYFRVALNVKVRYLVDTNTGGEGLFSGGADSVTVLTAGTPYVKNLGGTVEMGFSATAEAQKNDWMSRRSFPKTANWIFECMLERVTAPDNAAVDVDVGIASGTHATDFESVAEFVAFHLDGADDNIDAHSDDGTTDVAPTDTTLDIATGTGVFLAIDGRDETNCLLYVNGVRVLSGTTFTLAAASAALKLILHMEKTSDDSPGVFQAVAGVRICE